jgi:NAD(P)-dependent dehydrogenase (short-subunit alcohol dehydrogenase family)
VGQQVMSERDRLRALQVREAGQQVVAVDRRPLEQRALEVADRVDQRSRRRLGPEPEGGRDLVVPRPPGVDAPADVAEPGDQSALDQECTSSSSAPGSTGSAATAWSASAIAVASAGGMMPCRPSIRTCAWEARTS